MEPGCAEIQSGPSATPLILIHDGSGAIISYYMLGELNRPVYGIANPHFDSGEPWAGGVPQMASTYVEYIESTISKGDILLGGWSFGGMLALQVSHLLADHAALRVKGIVMIDSPYPNTPIPSGIEVIFPPIPFAPTTKAEIREKVVKCMEDARRSVAAWTLPVWNSGTPPAGILLRAKEPVLQSKTESTRVDLARGDRLLGWKNYGYDFVKDSIDVPGSHYELFSVNNLEVITDKIKLASDSLDT